MVTFFAHTIDFHTYQRKVLAFPIGLRYWRPWHGCAQAEQYAFIEDFSYFFTVTGSPECHSSKNTFSPFISSSVMQCMNLSVLFQWVSTIPSLELDSFIFNTFLGILFPLDTRCLLLVRLIHHHSSNFSTTSSSLQADREDSPILNA